MEALGFLSPIETARASVQEKIADFLAARARLRRLMSNPSLTIQGQAKGLYVKQTQLEDQLQKEIMPKMNAISTGVWDMSDIITLGGFAATIMKQISDVNGLGAQGGGVVSSSFIDMTSVLMVGIPVLAVIGFLLMRK